MQDRHPDAYEHLTNEKYVGKGGTNQEGGAKTSLDELWRSWKVKINQAL